MHFSYFVSFLILAASAFAEIIKLNDDNFDQIVDGSKVVFIKFYAKWCGPCKKLAPVWHDLAGRLASSADVIIAEVDVDYSEDLVEKFGIKGMPTLKLLPKGTQDPRQAIEHKGKQNIDSLLKFVQDNSAPVVAAPLPVKPIVLTSANYDQIVNDPTKHVLVKFYSPDCSHCARLAPIYKRLAELYANQENVVIAELNGEQFERIRDRYEMYSYPTIYLFPAGSSNKAPRKFLGKNLLQPLVDFTNRHCGLQVQVV